MSEQFLATASVRIVPDVTGFAAALQAEVTAAAARVRIPAVSGALAKNTVATRTFAAATGVSTLAVKTATDQLLLEGAAEGKSAAAKAINTKAARDSAVAHGQMARGLATATASQFGLRGAVLASSGPFLAAVVGVEVLVKSLHEASAEAESLARVQKILGPALASVSEAWAKQAADIGLSTAEALKFEGAIAEVFHNVGLAASTTGVFSEQLVNLSTDVAAFNNADPSQVLRAFQLALSGNLRGLRQFVPGVTAARVALRAMADTGKVVKADLTDQELTVARFEVIMQKAANQVGAFADRQDSLAVKTKILKANLADLSVSIGNAFVPALSAVATEVTKDVHLLAQLNDLFHKIPGPTDQAASSQSHFQRVLAKTRSELEHSLINPLGVLSDALKGFPLDAGPVNVEMETLGKNFTGLLDPILSATDLLKQFVAELQVLGGQISGTLGSILSGTQEAVLRTQISGGSLQDVLQGQQAAVAVAQGAAASSILAAIGAKPGTKAGDAAIQARRDAEQTLKDNQDAVAATQAEIAAAAKKGATAAKKAGKSRQEILDQQDQDLLDAQKFAQGQLDLAAENAKSLQQQIAVDRARLALDERQIAQAKKQIHSEQLKKETIQALQIAEAGTRAEIKKLEEDRAQAAKARAQLIADRKKERLDLDIQIAETNKNIAAEKRALEARIAYDRQQLRNVHGDLVRKKQLQLEIAQDTQTLKDLKKAKQENMGASAAFLFLQTQQGFAGTLLGNLLSAAATAGTVGGTAGAISTRSTFVGNPLPPPGTGFPKRPSADLSAAAQIAGGPAGASSGQLATLIHVQRQMLAVMLRLAGQRTHPEATTEHWWQSTVMLNTGW